MKRKKCLLFSLFCLLTPLYTGAILPPLWQSRDEIKSLLESPEIGRYLNSSEAILEIKREEFGYSIVTTKNTLEAHIHYLPQKMPGPATFSWDFSLKTQ